MGCVEACYQSLALRASRVYTLGMRKIVLASASKWRRDILAKTGLKFGVEKSAYAEDLTLELPPRALAKKLALGKALDVAAWHTNAIVIGADTFVYFRGKVIGKPQTGARARKTLGMLSGKTHSIFTGFAIVDSRTGKHLSRAVETRVHFRKLAAREIDSYVKSGEPLYVAGGYAIQGRAGMFIDGIEGDYWNVAGLPLAELVQSLKKFNVKVK